MTSSYINYPNPRISYYTDPNSAQIKKHQKADQRTLIINQANLSEMLNRFATHQYRFSSTAKLNDMWLQIDFSDAPFEIDVLAYIQRLIGRHYPTLGAARTQIEGV